MEEKVLNTIRRYHLLEGGGKVIVALSGGADSVALFHFLLHFSAELGIDLAAAHFEHGLRGEESLKDAHYVEELCESNGIQLYMNNGRMNEKEKPSRLGVEAWARQLRYAFFAQLAKTHKARIATAHTQTDNAETLIFNLIRGAGPKGLGGIPPQRGPYIRPLLEVSRAEVEDYCHRHGLHFVTDSTNADSRFSRNRIRNQAMPVLEQVHPGVEKTLARTAADMRQLDAWLELEAEKLLHSARLAEAGDTAWRGSEMAPMQAFSTGVLRQPPQPLRIKALAMLAGPGADRAAIARLEQVLAGDVAGTQLPGGQCAFARGAYLCLYTAAQPAPDDRVFSAEAGTFLFEGGYRLQVSVLPAAANCELSAKSEKKGLTFLADYDKISEYGVLRTKRQGDSYAPKGRGCTKSLKKWMNEAKIPRHLRAHLPVLAQGSRVLWVWGAGFCEGVRPDAATKRLLVIHTETP